MRSFAATSQRNRLPCLTTNSTSRILDFLRPWTLKFLARGRPAKKEEPHPSRMRLVSFHREPKRPGSNLCPFSARSTEELSWNSSRRHHHRSRYSLHQNP